MSWAARVRVWVSLVVATMLVAVLTAPVSAQSEPDGEASLDRLQADTGGDLRVSEHAGTGLVRFVGTEAGEAVARPPGVAADARPEAAARGFFDRHGALLGIDDAGTQLELMREEPLPGKGARGSNVRLRQVHEGVPVVAGEFSVQLDDANRVLSVMGEALPDLDVDTDPTVSAEDAAATALAKVAKDHEEEADDLEVAAPELWIHNPMLLEVSDVDRSRLVWRTEVTGTGDHPVRELVLIDALDGGIALTIDQVGHARNRIMCDNQNNTAITRTCSAGRSVRSEGQAATGIADVDNVYDYTGHTYDYFKNTFNRDSIDGAGMPMLTTVRYCEPGQACPYANAFWDGAQMTYGQGLGSDDVVAHEIGHGITEFTSGLFYYYQSGAINEAMSDIYGEIVDLTNGAGNDSAAVRWLIGEDTSLGVLRNMANPPQFGDPDRMQSPIYHSEAWDHGGVHINSGVLNKAAFLLADGATFNGVTVTGIGLDKMGRVFHGANATLLTSGSDYQDLFDAAQQACTNLIGSHGITAANCTQVTNAVTATEMHLQPLTGAAAPEAPICPAGQSPNHLFYDGMENTGSGNWDSVALAGTSQWTYTTGYAHGGVRSLYTTNQNVTSDTAVFRTGNVSPASGQTTYVHFAHAFEFESDRWDGGVVEYSTNNGSTWTDAGSLFTHNGYTGTIKSGNPLGGRLAFVNRSFGYYSSRMNISSLAGQNVRFRFRVGTDSTIGALGWLIDDFRVYTCSAAPSGQPDLVVSALANPPASGTAGGTFTVNDTTANAGNAAAGESRTRYYLSTDTSKDAGDRLLSGARVVPALAAGANNAGSRTVTIPANMASGSYYLIACADDTNLVTESNEGNNCRVASGSQITIGAAGQPDLIVTTVGNPPTSAAPGGTFTASDTTRNQGTAAAGENRTRYYLSADTTKDAGDRQLSGARIIASLAPSTNSAGTRTVTIPANMAHGSYWLFACADDTNLVAESNENNNCRRATGNQIQVGVAGQPDLRVSALADPPVSATSGGSFTVSDTTRNAGTAAAGESRTRYYLSSTNSLASGTVRQLQGARIISSLAAGATNAGSRSVTIPSNLAPGNYWLWACADDTNLVVESNETNNCRRATGNRVAVTGPQPDLRVTAVADPPASVVAGGKFSVSDTTKNVGQAAAGENRTRYYLTSTKTMESGTIRRLGAVRIITGLGVGETSSGSRQATVPVDLAPGNYWLWACADDTNLVTESDETNNCRRATGNRIAVTN